MEANDRAQIAMDKQKARGFEPISSFNELPHIKVGDQELQGRRIPLAAVYDDNDEWYYWFRRPDGRLQPLMAVPVEAIYYGKVREHPDDFYFHFLDFIFQRASFEKALHWSQCIVADLHNLGTSLAKLRFIFEHRQPNTHCAHMAETEIEYIFMVCRSSLDLLQETVSELWPMIRFENLPDKKQQLPTSFAEMVMIANKPMTAEAIAKRHKLPDAIAKVYAECGEFLTWFRAYRDKIAHRGESINTVFVMDDGFGVATNQMPFSKMPIWSPANTRANEIGSVHAAACYIISCTLVTFDRMADLFMQTIRWPTILAPGYTVFIRGHFIHELSRLEQGISETPWYSVKPADDALSPLNS